MSEQKKPSFMEELDRWTDENVITPLLDALAEDLDQVEPEVKKAIRQKVLESYRNGQAAGPRQPLPERRKVYPR